MRVFAVDGSTCRLPDRPEILDHFGAASDKAMGRVSILHDILNRLTYDAILAPYKLGEADLAHQHLEDAQLPPGSLIILDRGYVHFPLLRNLVDEGHHFCVRLKSNLRIYKDFIRSGLSEAIDEWEPSEGIKRGATPNSHLRRSLKVRLLRFEAGGQEYVLMTSLLDATAFPILEMADLYHQRWEVEESYKVKKCRMRIEEMTGTSPEIVLQDFHAKVFAECFTAALLLELREEVEAYCLTTRNEYKISFTQVIAKMKDTIVLLFLRKQPSRLIADLFKIFRKCLVDLKPGRRCRRKNAGRNAPKLQTQSMGYKFNR